MQTSTGEYWARLLRLWRSREGLSQAELGELLGVDQTSVSRWERAVDLPRVGMRRRIRDAIRASSAGRQDKAIRARIRQALWPQTLVRRGAVFLEASSATLGEAGMPIGDLRGRSIYGTFGPLTDHVTEQWEKSGIFSGELALCMTVNVLQTADGPAYIRTVDTPYFSSADEIWCSCEVKRIDEREYQRLRQEFRGVILSIPFDGLA